MRRLPLEKSLRHQEIKKIRNSRFVTMDIWNSRNGLPKMLAWFGILVAKAGENRARADWAMTPGHDLGINFGIAVRRISVAFSGCLVHFQGDNDVLSRRFCWRHKVSGVFESRKYYPEATQPIHNMGIRSGVIQFQGSMIEFGLSFKC